MNQYLFVCVCVFVCVCLFGYKHFSAETFQIMVAKCLYFIKFCLNLLWSVVERPVVPCNEMQVI
jgi:hypothetical protein